VLVVILFLVPTGTVTDASGASTGSLSDASSARASIRRDLLAAINAVRAADGLLPLQISGELSTAAAAHSDEMLGDGYFGHNSADGMSFWRRIAAYYPLVPGYSWDVGENLLWSSPGMDASAAVAAWMRSPKHRANVLSPGWRQIGIAVIRRDGAPGVFGGHDVMVVTADFGARTAT
jgi:uncharacterized protein YkwD